MVACPTLHPSEADFVHIRRTGTWLARRVAWDTGGPDVPDADADDNGGDPPPGWL